MNKTIDILLKSVTVNPENIIFSLSRIYNNKSITINFLLVIVNENFYFILNLCKNLTNKGKK